MGEREHEPTHWELQAELRCLREIVDERHARYLDWRSSDQRAVDAALAAKDQVRGTGGVHIGWFLSIGLAVVGALVSVFLALRK